MPFSIKGSIALYAVSYIITITLYFSRIYILRSQRHTKAFRITTICHTISTVVLLAGLGVMTDYGLRELRVRQKFRSDSGGGTAIGQEEVEAEVVKALFSRAVLKEIFVLNIFYTTMHWSLKAAFIGYFCELRQHQPLWLWRFQRATTVFVAASYVVIIGMQVGSCHPVSLNWTQEISGAGDVVSRCTAQGNFATLIVQASCNVLSDILILLIPLLTISNLILPERERIALVVIGLIGAAVPVLAIIRIIALVHINVSADSITDISRRTLGISVGEIQLANIAFFLPSLRVALRQRGENGERSCCGFGRSREKFFGGWKSGSSSWKSGGGSGSGKGGQGEGAEEPGRGAQMMRNVIRVKKSVTVRYDDDDIEESRYGRRDRRQGDDSASDAELTSWGAGPGWDVEDGGAGAHRAILMR